ncbi:hypothetical protein OnM2_067063 [Erysiphe neolycopersici]|uniref:Uncharacterized protein n=1 Tax=Erysiphe neolycopersici TaxID=212602 RepID=A0A420HM68_9PEZI|nr:hypothetical protein OnM2_067063 [Erysiphe neolycopersici]
MVKAYLDIYAETVTKIGNLRVNLKSAILKGPIPPFVMGAIKIPALQFTKEFQHTRERQAAANRMEEMTNAFRKKMLETCFEVKSEELNHLQKMAENLASGDKLKEEMTTFYQNIS